jgi:hypothetical protein
MEMSDVRAARSSCEDAIKNFALAAHIELLGRLI